MAKSENNSRKNEEVKWKERGKEKRKQDKELNSL